MKENRSPYSESIRNIAARQGHIGVDPRHVEAYMRLEHPTLDGLSKNQFAKEVATGIACVMDDGATNAEGVARSFGL